MDSGTPLELTLDGKSRVEAREIMLGLPRNYQYQVYASHRTSTPFAVWIVTDGKKEGEQGDDKLRRWVPVNRDFTVHYTGEIGNLNYIDDFLVDIRIKQAVLQERGMTSETLKEWTFSLYEAIKVSIELNPIGTTLESHPILTQNSDLTGHPIELMLGLTKWLGVQEDVNYWGTKYRLDRKTGRWMKRGKYDGRNKPVKAFYDYFIKKATLQAVFKNHFSMR